MADDHPNKVDGEMAEPEGLHPFDPHGLHTTTDVQVGPHERDKSVSVGDEIRKSISWGHLFKAYSQNTTGHGVRYLTQSSVPRR